MRNIFSRGSHIRMGFAIFFMTALTGCSMLTAPLPQVDGTLQADGLHAPVQVLRDQWGVPHVYANDLHDMFFAQGFVQAQDRWWQMDLMRHVARGRLGELVGSAGDSLTKDTYLRALGMYVAAERDAALVTGDVKVMFDAFTEGVNAYISKRLPSKLAIEYTALLTQGIIPNVEPWTNADSIVFSKLEAYSMAAPTVTEVEFEKILNQYGAAQTAFYAAPYPIGLKPTILENEDLPVTKQYASPSWAEGIFAINPAKSMAFTATDIDPASPQAKTFNLMHGASNNWIVNGTRTASGRPLFANDPHLGISMPSIVYQIGLHCTGKTPINVVGMAFAPAPGMVFGHNDRIAWGITAGKDVDVWDEYKITVNPENPLQYWWDGAWRNFTIRTETFTFGDHTPSVTVQVRETVHGPILNDIFKTSSFNNTDPRAVRWSALTEPSDVGSALLGMITAKSWQEYDAALASFDSPPLHFGYADVDGNIGYQLVGRVPVRAAQHSGMVPAPGDSSTYLWKGYVPYDKMARIYNPNRGYIVTGNNKIAPQAYFDQLTADLGGDVNADFQYLAFYGYRAERIIELLTPQQKHTIDSFKAIQTDLFSISADEVIPYLAQTPMTDPALVQGRDWMAAWDRRFTTDSPQAMVYNLFYDHLLADIYLDQADKPGMQQRSEYPIRLLLENPDNAWWDNTQTTNVVENRDMILAQAFSEAWNEATSRCGSDRSKWTLGRIHVADYVSLPLGVSGIGLIESLVNRGPYPAPGAMDTVSAGSWFKEDGLYKLDAAPAMRLIFDVGNWENSVAINCTGQSGHPASENYADQIGLYLKGKYLPMRWSHQKVEAAARHQLTLEPAKAETTTTTNPQ